MKESKAKPNDKDRDLAAETVVDLPPLTTSHGQPYATDQNSLRAGTRGPTLMEDQVFREKIQHFDHERIPERVVHARGAAAHGFFQVTDPLTEFTTARVLTDPSLKTPVFVRFSTVAGFRGSADTARDVRGFAVKMYTPEGNWDLVGNNIPVFFIQDAIKFPDLIHAVKPEPHNEIPQAASAHDTFYDFISFTPEAMHMIMWVMSDRAIPRSYAMMEGFGVHSFRLVNAEGKSFFVKFHWKPVLGVHSLVWDEAVKIAGQDPDFHRRDLFEGIEMGNFPEWELAVQIVPDGEESKFDFDILDSTKIIPEELVPLRKVGRLVLNRNPDNYFAETEQVAFMTSNVVPGIDFSNDPLLQGRNFSYNDTQLSRLGTVNFHELPINRPICPFSNNQRDGHARHRINKGRVAYSPSGLDGHTHTEAEPGVGLRSFPEQIAGTKDRLRSESFGDHYGQARLFWNSMSVTEKEHIVKALSFELSKVVDYPVRERMIGHLEQINDVLGAQVAKACGVKAKAAKAKAKPSGTADATPEKEALANAISPTTASGGLEKSAALSMEGNQPMLAKARLIAILAAPGTDAAQVAALQKALAAEKALGVIVGPFIGDLGGGLEATKTYANSSSVLFDAVFVPGGADGVAELETLPDAMHFVNEAFKHGKAIGGSGEGVDFINGTSAGALAAEGDPAALGVILGGTGYRAFIKAVAHHRFTNRPTERVLA